MTEATKKEAATPEAVTMTDGRIQDFPGKRQMLKDSFVKDGVVTTRLDFRNGETRTFVLPEALLLKAASHGIEQKLGDETAGLKDIDDMVLAIDELTDRLAKGEWNSKREANGMAGTSVLARALVEATGKTIQDIKTWLSAKSQAEKVALRNSPKIKPIVERLEAEKVAKGSSVDTDALLATLGG